MTISTELRKAGPFTGNGVTTAFPFSFKVFAATDVTATRADTLGAETGLVLNTDFTVALNADQDAAPGGTVTLAAPLSTGYRLVVSSAVPNLQPTDITNNGGFYPRVIEDALDRHVAQVQQIDEKVGRALKVAITSPLGDQALPSPVAGMLIGWNESSDGLKNYAPIGGTLLGQQLAAADGSSLVGFRQSGAGAVVRTAQDKMREWVSVKDFGAVGDGVTDDTAAVHAAIDYAKGRLGSVFFPAGTYRVTSGYTQSVAYADVRLYGEGSTRETLNLNTNPPSGSHIRLDSADASSFFYKVAARHHLQVENLLFSCAQYVLDRKFFAFDSGGSHSFSNINFESVEKPICYEPGCYFQSSTIENVQFRNSGTIHSELGGNNLRGTLLVLTDVHHEGAVPANSEKIVCNLSGIRQIQGINFLLEGAGPGADWTILRLQNPYASSWTREQIATFHGYWSEWSGVQPLYTVHQSGGRVVFDSTTGVVQPATSKYKLDTMGAVELRNASFSGASYDVSTAFELEDYLCQVSFNEINARNFGRAKTTPNFTITNCSEARDGASLLLVGTAFGNKLAQKLWEFDGGYVDQGKVSFNVFGGGSSYPSTDSVYGRKLVIVPNVDTVDVRFAAKVFQKTQPGQQCGYAARLKLPTFTGGAYQIKHYIDSAVVGLATLFDSSYSGSEVEFVFPFVDTVGGKLQIGFTITSVSATGTSGNLEIYHAAIYLGKELPHTTLPSYPTNVVTYATAAPTLGSWTRGDVVWNSSPSASGVPGWVCVTTGTPGTWKAMAALAA